MGARPLDRVASRRHIIEWNFYQPSHPQRQVRTYGFSPRRRFDKSRPLESQSLGQDLPCPEPNMEKAERGADVLLLLAGQDARGTHAATCPRKLGSMPRVCIAYTRQLRLWHNTLQRISFT